MRAAAAKLDVLIVEDHRDTAESLRVLLEIAGHRAHVACDGPAALRALETVRPDAVLVDLGLPGMSGQDLALRLRSHPACKDSMIMALSGYVDDAIGPESAFDSHLEKPVDPDVLLEHLARVSKGG